jgi:hypothetical protein
MLKIQISLIYVLLQASESYVPIVLIMIWANVIHHRLYFFCRCGQLNQNKTNGVTPTQPGVV